MSKISVIVPVYKTEAYIHRCVDSILSQTFTDFELVLVDDGSPDNCGTICDEYAEKDNRVRVFHQENRGQAAARNLALDWIFRNSDSDFISFVDSDDWVHPQYLELLYEANIQFGTNISQCLHVETDGTKEIPPVEDHIYLISSEEQYTEWYSAFFWCKLFRVSIFDSLRFPEGQIYEDVAIWYKVLFAEERIGLVREVLYYYFINSFGTVRSDWTPAKLAQVKAWEDQMTFFSAFGNKTLLDCATMHLFQILIQHIRRISESKNISQIEKRKYGHLIKKKLWRAIFRYKKAPYFKQNSIRILEIAFPRIMWLYWTFYGIKRKLSIIIKRREP